MARIHDCISPRGIMRLLVISYFIAMSLGLISGTQMIEFMIPVLPDGLATILMRGLILILSVLVIAGFGRRHAALVLALVVFFSSYTTLYSGGDIGAFWRDLALIGALLMTADLGTTKEEEIDWDLSEDEPQSAPVPPQSQQPTAAPLDDQPFREDFDLARAT